MGGGVEEGFGGGGVRGEYDLCAGCEVDSMREEGALAVRGLRVGG